MQTCHCACDSLFLIHDVFIASKHFSLDLGFLSADQEKAIDRFDHLFKMLKAFQFGPLFSFFVIFFILGVS